MSAPSIADQAERDAALDPSRSFIVQAPAGSGKTDLLVKRYTKLLSLVEKPEEILAITFTRKAAAEMRSRVLANLPDSAEIAHRLRIQTIDSLCTALTRQMPVLSRFGAQPAIVEDASDLYREAAARVLAELTPPVERLLRHLDNFVGNATSLLTDLLRNRDRWLRKTGVAPTREELEAAFALERSRLLRKARALHPKASEEWAKELLTKNEFEWRKKHPEAQALARDGELSEPLREALEALCKMPPEKYSEDQWEALSAILALLFPALAQLKIVFSETGKADFTEFMHGALQALGSVEDPTDLLLALDSRISHILVDEFQDTSQSQFSLLEKLTLGWEPGDGRTLFLVGDPMQSIYRFREAEVSLFLRAKHTGVGAVPLEPLVLATNFRSQAGLVSWFNASFPRILPAREDEASGSVPYSPASAHHPALPGPAVTWHGFFDRDAEALRVTGLIRESSGKTAILVRNRAHLDRIVPALKEAGIRFRAVDIEQLGERQVVQDLYALTRALSHPGDRVAWLSILRAPWCGLLLLDLLNLCEQEGQKQKIVWERLQNLERLSPDGRLRAARLREALAPAIANRLRGTLRDRVESTWLALGGPACVDDATGLEDAEIYLDELERLEAAGEVDMDALAERLNSKLYALPDVAAGDDAVEIMTIHKAKGLEFDTVIVPGLDRSPRAGFRPLFAWKSLVRPPDKGGGELSASGGLLLAPINETGTDKEPAYNYIRELEKEAQDIEAGRLFYVAATRAESRLHLLACAACEEDATLKQPGKRSLLSKIWWQAQAHFGPPPAEIADQPQVKIPDLLRRVPADFAVATAPASTAWIAADERGEEARIEFSWAGETARHVGTIVHRWLQRIAEDEVWGWDAGRVESLRARFTSELMRRGVSGRELPVAAQLVVTALKNALSDARGQWVLGPHAEARNEYRLRVRGPEGTRTYIVDRVFRDTDGTRWIVDYKTSRHEGSDVERFLDRERERYAAQLRLYLAALENSRAGLYFPMHKGWRQENVE